MEISPKTTKNGKIEGFASKGEAYYNPKTNTLTLDNVKATRNITFLESGTIELIGENSVPGIKNTHNTYISKNGNLLTIKGDGELYVESIVVNKLLVKNCTLYIDSGFFLSEIGHLRAERANIIITFPYLVLDIKRSIDLQECNIVFNSCEDNVFKFDKDSPNVVIIQKDR